MQRRDVMRTTVLGTVLLAGLNTCGTATAGPDELTFEIRRLDVGGASSDILVLDHDGDGNLDLLVNGGRRVTVLLGDGAGHFEARDVVDAGEHPVDIDLGDLDEDGHMDVVVANHETRYVTLLFGSDDGLGTRRAERLDVDVSPHPHAVSLADLDADGHLDLVVDDRDRRRLQVYAGRGDGSFTPSRPIDVGGDPYRGMTIADVDGDRRLDVVTPNPRRVAIQLGDGHGGFTPGPDLASGAMPPFSTAVGDFDGDGVADIAAGSGEGRGAVAVWLGSGAGEFALAPGSPYEIAQGPTAMSTADVDGDGIADILVTSYVGDEVAVVLGGAQLRVVRIPLGDNPWGVAAGDLDGDGLVDLVTGNDGAPRISILLRRAER